MVRTQRLQRVTIGQITRGGWSRVGADSARQDWRRQVEHIEIDFRTKSAAAS